MADKETKNGTRKSESEIPERMDIRTIAQAACDEIDEKQHRRY